MSCKLHIPVLYDPRHDAVVCRCGAVVITAVESTDTGRWRWFFRRRSYGQKVSHPNLQRGNEAI